MDCNTARLLLQLGRPGAARDLDGPEAAELDAHLNGCPVCQHLDLDQRRLDAALGAAMHKVEVPAGLKEQILLRLEAERGARHRRWGGRVFLSAGALAASLLLAWGLWVLYGPSRPTIDAETVVRDYNILRPDKSGADEHLKKLGLPACAPRFVNYNFLVGLPAAAVLPGTEEKKPLKVAQFVFADKGERAVVFAVPRRSAKLEWAEEADQGYTYRLAYDAGYAGYVYLILHTGKDWKWLQVDDVD